MPTMDFLLQGMETSNHKNAINELLGIGSPEEIVISVAFLRENGFDLIKDKLSSVSPEKVKFYVGIRNSITSIQVINAILKEGYTIYAVDTGTSSSDFIYHPKIYLSQNSESAKVIIGSANLTQSGLTRNIEASVLLGLNKANEEDQSFLNKITTSLNNLLICNPENVIPITNARQIITLKNDGKLADERISTPPATGTNTRDIEQREYTPRMNIFIEEISRTQRTRATTRLRTGTSTSLMPAISSAWTLVWTSSPLTQRDLNIPTGTNTNPTGSMGMKKGEWEDIDQRHYFREEVFNELDWRTEPTRYNPVREMADVSMQLIIKGIAYQPRELKLTHDPRTDTRTYQQNNFVTGLRWGYAKPLIAQNDLLGRKIKLYKKIVDGIPKYLMQID